MAHKNTTFKYSGQSDKFITGPEFQKLPNWLWNNRAGNWETNATVYIYLYWLYK